MPQVQSPPTRCCGAQGLCRAPGRLRRTRSCSRKRTDAAAVFVRPNVRAKPTAEADAGWPRRDDSKLGLERPGGGCRSGSAP